MSDWESVKARLERHLREWPDCKLDERADIRAALAEVERLEGVVTRCELDELLTEGKRIRAALRGER